MAMATMLRRPSGYQSALSRITRRPAWMYRDPARPAVILGTAFTETIFPT
ncbi:hypothetical protein [Sphingomonas sp.]|nr:hypothetical protein [Sphingomonas sp.]